MSMLQDKELLWLVITCVLVSTKEPMIL